MEVRQQAMVRGLLALGLPHFRYREEEDLRLMRLLDLIQLVLPIVF